MSENNSSKNRIKPKEELIGKAESKIKLIAKKGIKISGPGGKVSISKGDDCSEFGETIKKRLRDNGVI